MFNWDRITNKYFIWQEFSLLMLEHDLKLLRSHIYIKPAVMAIYGLSMGIVYTSYDSSLARWKLYYFFLD